MNRFTRAQRAHKNRENKIYTQLEKAFRREEIEANMESETSVDEEVDDKVNSVSKIDNLKSINIDGYLDEKVQKTMSDFFITTNPLSQPVSPRKHDSPKKIKPMP